MLDFAAVSLVFQVSSDGYVLWDQILEKTEEKSFRRQAAKLNDGVLGFRWKNCEQDGTSCTYVQSNYASSQKMLIYFDVVYKKREHTMSFLIRC